MTLISDVKGLLSISEEISKKIKGDKRNSLRLECMNGLGIYTTYIHVDNMFSKWVNSLLHKSIILPADRVYGVTTTSFAPYPTIIRDNVKIEDSKLIIDLSPALKSELFSIEIAYKMDDDFIKGLVRARSPRELLEDKVKYELSAQLRNPEALQLNFSEIEIEEFPVHARVHIADQINTNVPNYMKKLIEVENEILSNDNPYGWKDIQLLHQEKTRLKRKLGKRNIEERVKQMALLLEPSTFLNYVRVMEDFKLDNCNGKDYYRSFGMLPLPRFMEVISRTDLNLDKPAAKGTLIYESKMFDDEIKNMF